MDYWCSSLKCNYWNLEDLFSYIFELSKYLSTLRLNSKKLEKDDFKKNLKKILICEHTLHPPRTTFPGRRSGNYFRVYLKKCHLKTVLYIKPTDSTRYLKNLKKLKKNRLFQDLNQQSHDSKSQIWAQISLV